MCYVGVLVVCRYVGSVGVGAWGVGYVGVLVVCRYVGRARVGVLQVCRRVAGM